MPALPGHHAALLLLALSLAAGCGQEPHAPEPPRPERSPLLDAPARDADEAVGGPRLAVPQGAPTVVFLGDSIGAGLHLAEERAFPAVLQRLLAEEDLPFRLVNASESGRTSAGGSAALDWVLRTDPDLVVIELGGNDGLRGVSPEDTERNLRSMIERSRAAGAAVLLLGVRLPPNYGQLAQRFDTLYPALAEEYDTAFVPFFMEGVGGLPEMNLSDGLHPTIEGHERLAQNILPTLREELRKLPQR